MGSVSSINAGVSDLLQIFSNFGAPILSSPAVVSALEAASPADIVQLSVAATQLEGVNAMFGISDDSDADTSNTLANLEVPQAVSAGAAPTATATPASTQSTASLADQAANYQADLQEAEAQSLVGIGTTNSLSDLFA